MSEVDCICSFSMRLCKVHGERLSDCERNWQLGKAIDQFCIVENVGLSEVMDEQLSDDIAEFLRTDIALPHDLREFLADAFQGKSPNWRLEWKSAKPGPANTVVRYQIREKRKRDLETAAMNGLDRIDENEPVESIVAEIMAECATTRAKAYAALKDARKLQPHLKRISDFDSSDGDSVPKSRLI